MVVNGGIEPKIMGLSNIYAKLWPIFDFSCGCLATKFEKRQNSELKAGRNLVLMFL